MSWRDEKAQALTVVFAQSSFVGSDDMRFFNEFLDASGCESFALEEISEVEGQVAFMFKLINYDESIYNDETDDFDDIVYDDVAIIFDANGEMKEIYL